jgi:hypothetical protein
METRPRRDAPLGENPTNSGPGHFWPAGSSSSLLGVTIDSYGAVHDTGLEGKPLTPALL